MAVPMAYVIRVVSEKAEKNLENFIFWCKSYRVVLPIHPTRAKCLVPSVVSLCFSLHLCLPLPHYGRGKHQIVLIFAAARELLFVYRIANQFSKDSG